MIDSNKTTKSHSNDSNAQHKSVIVTAELKRQKEESRKRNEQLALEQQALEQIRELLTSEEQVITHRISKSKEDLARLSQKKDELLKKQLADEADLEKIVKEVTLLEQRYSEQAKYKESVNNDIALFEKKIFSRREWISSVTSGLESGRAAMARIDQRMSRKIQAASIIASKSQETL